jgi:transposase
MITEEFFDLLLELGDDWEVKAVQAVTDSNEVEICVEYVGQAKPYDYAPVRRWRHLNMFQFKSFISARLPRFKSSAGKVETLCPPWAEKHERFTVLFECLVIELLLATQNQTQTARLLGCKFDVVNRIMHRASARGMARRRRRGPAPPDGQTPASDGGSGEVIEQLSIDEKSFKKGHQFATILSDPLGERVLDMVETRSKEACKELFDSALSPQQQAAVKSISMDMWQAFISAASEYLPQAEIVHDKFHLIQYLNKAIDQVRRREIKGNEELKNSRYALLKNTGNLTDKQKIKFEQIKQANFEVSRAWEARENFKDAFNDSAFEASAFEANTAIFEQWYKDVHKTGIQEVIKVAEMFSNHLKGVLNAMTSNLSNAKAERLNGKIQLLKSIGRGYRRFENFRSAILFFHGKLDLSPLNYR